MTSGSEGDEPKVEPFVRLAERGDFMAAEFLALLEVVDSLSALDVLELLRLNRPMVSLKLQLKRLQEPDESEF